MSSAEKPVAEYPGSNLRVPIDELPQNKSFGLPKAKSANIESVKNWKKNESKIQKAINRMKYELSDTKKNILKISIYYAFFHILFGLSYLYVRFILSI